MFFSAVFYHLSSWSLHYLFFSTRYVKYAIWALALLTFSCGPKILQNLSFHTNMPLMHGKPDLYTSIKFRPFYRLFISVSELFAVSRWNSFDL